MRSDVEQLRKRFYLDAPSWFNDTEHQEFLQAAFDAVWSNRRLKIHYRSWNREKSIKIAPLGVGGSWYLVGQGKQAPRTYKIMRIQSLKVLDDSFLPPENFNLARYWQENNERLDQEIHTTIAHV